MKAKGIFIALVYILTAFGACKEEDEIKNTVPLIKKASLYSGNKLVLESNYVYDAACRLIKLTDTNNTSLEYFYSADWVIIKGTFMGMNYTDTLALNDKGQYMGDIPVETIEYDAQGYMIKRTNVLNNIPNLNTYEIEDGNTIHWIEKGGKNYENINNDEEYEFLPNSINTIGYENTGFYHYGKQNKNLMSGIVTTYYSNTGIEKLRLRFEYELDAQNRVVKKAVAHTQGNYTLYTYY